MTCDIEQMFWLAAWQQHNVAANSIVAIGTVAEFAGLSCREIRTQVLAGP